VCYSGHKRQHCLKYQIVGTPDGMIVDMFGPIEGRHADGYLLDQSRLLQRLEANEEFSSSPRYWQLYGDQGYALRPRLCCPHKGITTDAQSAFNDRMKSIRQPIEWIIGHVVGLWRFLDWSKTQQLGSSPVGLYARVAAFLTNLHVCCYGSETAQYFVVNTPTLAEYLHRF